VHTVHHHLEVVLEEVVVAAEVDHSPPEVEEDILEIADIATVEVVHIAVRHMEDTRFGVEHLLAHFYYRLADQHHLGFQVEDMVQQDCNYNLAGFVAEGSLLEH